jgi:hypothetical protein
MPAPYLSAHQRSLLSAARKQELMAYQTALGTITLVAGASIQIRPLGVRMAIRAGYVVLGAADPASRTEAGSWRKVAITDLGLRTLEEVEAEIKARREARKRSA